MPEKITDASNISVSLVYFVAVIGSIISSYVFFVVRSVNKNIESIKQDIKERFEKKDIDIGKIFDKIDEDGRKLSSIERDLKNLRHDHDKNHRGK